MRLMRLFLLGSVCLIIGLLASACQAESPAPAQATSAPATSVGAPASPAATASAVRLTPTPAPGTSSVKGVLLRLSDKAPLSEAQGIDLFLGVVTHGENGFAVAGIDKLQAPRAFLQADGTFIFLNIPPGEYAIVFSAPTQEFLIREPNDSNRDRVINVEADKPIDLGTLEVDYRN
jgi:hypothetical protein